MNEGFNVSVITVMEFLGFNGFGEEERDIAGRIIELANVVYIDEEIVSEVILTRTKQKIKLPDAIIAATAKVHELKLITRNVDDFRNIVVVENPFENRS